MTVLLEKIDVARPIEEAFAYVSDFTSTLEWDSTVTSAVKLTPGSIGIGTEFEVVCALPVGSVTIVYKVTDFQADQLIELSGTSKLFDILDTISFSRSVRGTKIEYRAEFTFPSIAKPFASLSQSSLNKMGRESLAGLQLALDDNFPAPTTSTLTRRADQLLLPGISLFSRLGYKLGRKNFKPISASVKGKHMVVTGATAGLGLSTAQELARRGAQLTLVVRDEKKAKDTVAGLIRETGNTNIHYEIADLSLLSEVDDLISRMLKRGHPVDVLINNAGALFNPRQETSEGLEKSYALLLLSPYRLTEGLKPLLLKASAPRVINVVSGGMYSQKLDVDALPNNDSQKYSGSVAYAREKRALMVLTQEWARDWAQEGIVVNAMHPGWADTPGVQDALPLFRKVTKSVLRSSSEGADTIVWLAVASEAAAKSGQLFLDREVRPAHLLRKTRDPEGERDKLLKMLSEFSSAAA